MKCKNNYGFVLRYWDEDKGVIRLYRHWISGRFFYRQLFIGSRAISRPYRISKEVYEAALEEYHNA